MKISDIGKAPVSDAGAAESKLEIDVIEPYYQDDGNGEELWLMFFDRKDQRCKLNVKASDIGLEDTPEMLSQDNYFFVVRKLIKICMESNDVWARKAAIGAVDRYRKADAEERDLVRAGFQLCSEKQRGQIFRYARDKYSDLSTFAMEHGITEADAKTLITNCADYQTLV